MKIRWIKYHSANYLAIYVYLFEEKFFIYCSPSQEIINFTISKYGSLLSSLTE